MPSLPQPQRHTALRHPTRGETTLFLIRHGHTESNAQLLLHGVTDVPLNPLGHRQAELIAERQRSELRLEAILSSPLVRALTTAQIIGERVGLEPTIVPGLMEVNFGTLEGISIARFADEHPELAVRMLDLDDFDVGWPEGESRREFHERVLTTFQAILEEYAAHAVAVVTHGGVIGSLVNQIRGVSPNDILAYDFMNCSMTHVDVMPDHTDVHRLNDVVHLEILDVEPDDETSRASAAATDEEVAS